MSRRARLVDFVWSCRRNHVMGNPNEHKPIRTHAPLSVRNTKQFGHIHLRFGYQIRKLYQLVCRRPVHAWEDLSKPRSTSYTTLESTRKLINSMNTPNHTHWSLHPSILHIQLIVFQLNVILFTHFDQSFTLTRIFNLAIHRVVNFCKAQGQPGFWSSPEDFGSFNSD